jgi:hypothetical protein
MNSGESTEEGSLYSRCRGALVNDIKRLIYWGMTHLTDILVPDRLKGQQLLVSLSFLAVWRSAARNQRLLMMMVLMMNE